MHQNQNSVNVVSYHPSKACNSSENISPGIAWREPKLCSHSCVFGRNHRFLLNNDRNGLCKFCSEKMFMHSNKKSLMMLLTNPKKHGFHEKIFPAGLPGQKKQTCVCIVKINCNLQMWLFFSLVVHRVEYCTVIRRCVHPNQIIVLYSMCIGTHLWYCKKLSEYPLSKKMYVRNENIQ